MRIKILNQKELATTVLRRDALRIMRAGLDAVETGKIVRSAVKRVGEKLTIGGKTYRLNQYHRIFVLGIGKSSFDAAKALETILGSRITDGVVLDVKGGKLKYLKSVVGTHPFPSEVNIRATAEIMGILKGVDSRDLVLTIISGGGSALLCWPYEMERKDITNITRALMAHGATIQEINTVRKHTSEIQGGQFARLAYPASVVSLIFSDVVGDDLSMVASGPTVLDTTTVKDARRVLKKYNILNLCQLKDCALKETPKDPLFFSHVENHLLVSNSVALEAMDQQARKLGYESVVYSNTLIGEARDVGRLLASLAKPRQALIAGGETTVTLRGKGKGGRNQEVALGALETLPPNTLVCSLGSDGIDNSSFAGALVDQGVSDVVKSSRINPQTYLKKNDSLAFFTKTKSYIETGVTGINVADLMLCLSKKA